MDIGLQQDFTVVSSEKLKAIISHPVVRRTDWILTHCPMSRHRTIMDEEEKTGHMVGNALCCAAAATPYTFGQGN